MARILQLLAIGAGGVALVGCGTTARYVGEQGGSWEAVLPGPAVTAALAPDAAEGAWYLTRRDASLAPAGPGTVTAANDWPAPDRPSLERPIYIRVHRSPESFIYYRTEERYEEWRGWRR